MAVSQAHQRLTIENSAGSFAGILTVRAAETPDKIVYRFLQSGEEECGSFTYQQLKIKAQAIAACLLAAGGSGKRAILLYAPGLEYVAAFYGCLYAGVIAVPAYPPKRNRSDARLRQIIADAAPEFVLTSSKMEQELKEDFRGLGISINAVCIATDNVPEGLASEWQNPKLTPDTVAFLQFSSGSISTPRGVIITHGNLLHNSARLHHAFGYDSESICVSWLPLFHDMGLIGGVLQPVYGDFPCILMSPMAFLESPYRWLNAISRYRATLSGAPNFAYDLCARLIGEERKNLDLSSWAVAFNGAEPVRSATLKRFAETFAAYGFRATSFLPCYGLAEATLLVSGKKKREMPHQLTLAKTDLSQNRLVECAPLDKNAQVLIGCGQPAPGQEVVIVDPETTTPCARNEVGEIWVAGSSVAAGYWNRKAETQRTFQAHLANSGEGPYLRTGDLGFIHSGELIITGRLKDLIILRGRNYYPQDIEAASEGSHPALRAGGVAAFAIEEGDEEKLVILQEARHRHKKEDIPQMIAAIRRAVAETYELYPDLVVIVSQGSVLKTSSGKVRRNACREAFLQGKLKVLALSRLEAAHDIALQQPGSWSELNPEELKRHIEMLLQGQLGKLLDASPAAISLDCSLVSLGLDSMRALQFKHVLANQTGISLEIGDLLRPIPLRDLAALLAAQLNNKDGRLETRQKRAPVQARTGAEALPLSYGQEQLWLVHKLHPESCAYNEGYIVRIAGRIDEAALRQGLREIVRRHAVLRTVFRMTDAGPKQLVQPATGFELPLVEVAQDEPENALSLAVERLSRTPFDLENGPLLRAELLRLNEQDYGLVFVSHHIVMDGWSMGVLNHELSKLYQAYAQNGASSLYELQIQYGDYALWQRERLSGEVLAHYLRYWREQLAEMEVLELPTDYPRPATFSYRGASETVQFNAALTGKLKDFSRQEGVTLFVTLLTAFQVLLARYTQQWDVAVGSPVANRNQEEIEGLIGLFMNALVLRAKSGPHQSFRQALQQVRDTTLGAYAHQELPFERLVEELVPDRDLARSPLFQVMFALQNVSRPELQLGDLHLSAQPIENGTAKFDISLFVEENSEEHRARLEYSTDLFVAETIKQMLQHWQIVLQSAIAAPECRISELPLLASEEQRQLLLEWNDTLTNYDHEKCLHHLIEEQAARTPDAPAVAADAGQLTYSELNSKANQLAHYLRKWAVGLETRVGVCMDRSPEMMVALLAVLKAGGAYVPLDPAYPTERLEFMLSDAEAPVLLAQKKSASKIASYKGKVVQLDYDWPLIEHQPETAVSSGVTSHNLAYVIYTSGSTGKPKGVCVTHSNVLNFFAAMDSLAGHNGSGKWLSVTSVSFDISVFEIFWTLTRGFQVMLAEPRTMFGGELPAIQKKQRPAIRQRSIDFSLFYFAADSHHQSQPYRLLLEGARFADSHEFAAVWTPERHFHAFGGIYPNPSVTSAAVAAVTQRIQIRAGSVVLPLQNPLRVAEEWSVVDNLSEGRTGISFASGWQANDFALAPENYASRKEIMLRDIEVVRRLWRGETVAVKNGTGTEINVGIHPRPVQPELPVWLTAGGSPETFTAAGEIGANLLTHLLGQSIGQLAQKIQLYRAARRKHGHPGEGHVTLMIHTFLGSDMESVREKVRKPFSNYLVEALDLGRNSTKETLTQEDREALVEHSFNRYFETSGLMGTVTSCLETVERLKETGVDEIACLIDFGVDSESVISSLELLDQLRIISNPSQAESGESSELLSGFGPTHLQCTPSMASMFMKDQAAQRLLAPVQKLFLGGELLPVSTVHELRSVTSAQIYNMYGPTETTIWSAVCNIEERLDGSVPLGQPIANTQIYILDEQLHPLPAGIPGELYIGGAGVARGYLDRPELTSERFVPDAFSTSSGSRVYRTGDLARWRHDGQLEFLGRMDHQIKLLGYRIELGEIEKLLLEFPGVRRAVVVLREDKPSEKRLVAYLVPESGKELQENALRTYLKERLPEYMVPSIYVPLAELPHTPNGKIDRKALPPPDVKQETSAYIAPRNASEEMLCGIWVETLNRQRVSIHDNFFELGGQSLLAMQVVSRVRSVFGVELPLRALFEARTVAGLANWVDRARGGTQIAPPPLVHVAREENLPLSYAQQRLWFLDQLNPGDAAYNMPFGFRLSGELNWAVLHRSLREIIRRHEVLRTSFPAVQGIPVQQIKTEAEPAIEVMDLRLMPELEREERTLQLVKTEAVAGFNLGRGPLLRMKLLQLAEHDHILLVTMHHIVGDGWSSGILMREFSRLYSAFAQGGTSPLPELRIQYADFAVWQRQWLQGEVLEQQMKHWRQQLADVEPLELPTDYSRSASETNAGAALEWALSEKLSTQLRQLARKRGVTLFMTMVAGFHLLLSRYSGQNNTALGSPIAGRRWIETEDLIGFFVNTLVLRTDVNGNPGFAELLDRVRQMTLLAYQHQDVPFEKLVEDLQPERDLNRTPLFQAMLVFENVLQTELELPGLRLSQIKTDSEVAKFELLLRVDDVGAGIQGALVYRTALFAESSMKRLLSHFENLLTEIVSDEQKPVGELSLLNANEREQMLVEWNQTATGYPFKVMHELFEEQAKLAPDAPAVEHEDRELSYSELNRRSNQLAHYLRKLRVGPEVRVGICMERSLEMVIGLLAIMKAGGAYVPLDPGYPQERLQFMVEDAQIAVLLTEEKFKDLFSASRGKKIYLQQSWTEIAQESGADLGLQLGPQNLAYVIYTSGSTGIPKGVGIVHQGASVLMHWAREVLKPEELSGVLASTSICFDLSVFEIFVPLSWGGRVVIAANALALPQWLEEEKISLVNTVPSAMSELVRIQGVPSSVRVVSLAGEALRRSLVNQIYATTKVNRVLNLYGPSEDTTYSTWVQLREADDSASVGIGQPIANTQAYVLDEWQQPAPIGVVGELYLGGAGLGRGYLNRPELTAERFIPNPCSRIGGERLYRTGDQVKWQADGRLEFLGRLDHQVKMRGYRIELGEIEAALLQHQDVKQAVVMTRGDGADKQLVAYIVSKSQDCPVKISELRQRLSDKLPEYMVPGAYVLLDELPLTPNGKLNRKALPEPGRIAKEYVAPRTPAEQLLAQIWQEVLKIDRVGIRDNFFELGGHSLLATQLISRVREAFQVELPVRQLFERPTIENMSQYITALPVSADEMPELVPVSREDYRISDEVV